MCNTFVLIIIIVIFYLLSLYLSVFCLEYFFKDMSSLKNDVNFKFHLNCVDIQLSHLAFADDIMLLSRRDILSVSTMFVKLQHFCRVSGLFISSINLSYTQPVLGLMSFLIFSSLQDLAWVTFLLDTWVFHFYHLN